MIFTADKLKEARDAGYSDDEIFGFVSQSDPKFNVAKSEGYSLDEIAAHFSSQQAKPMVERVCDVLQGTAMDLEDAISVIGRIPQALASGIPAQFQKYVTGTGIPQKSESIESDLAFQANINKELEDRKASGQLGVMGGALREALPSLSASALPMAAAIPSSIVGTAVAGPIGGGTAAGLAAGAVSYRMQGADYLYRSFKQLEENKGSPLTDEEKAEAYKVLLPYAKDSALWEAGPEAVGNAVSLGVGKFVFGFGKEAATQLAKESGKAVEKHLARKIAEKSAAIVGGAGTEVGTEAITALGQYAPDMAAKQYAETGTTKGAPTEYPGGILQAAKDVAPATLATQALFMGAGGAVKLAGLPFEAKPKTPVQLTEDNIDIQANKEATNLSINPNDEVSKGLSGTIKSIQDNLVSKKEIYSVLEPTDPVAQTLKLEIQDDENRLILMQSELNKRAGVELTEAEKQQIELAKAITTPEVAAPVTEAITPSATVATKTYAQLENEALDIQNQISTEAGVSALIGVSDDNLTISGLESREKGKGTKALEIITSAADKNQTTITLKAEPKSGDVQRLKKLYSRFGFVDDPNFAAGSNRMIRFPAAEVAPTTPAAEVAPPTEPTIKESLPVAQEAFAITPAPVAETPAVTEAPAAEVAPAEKPKAILYRDTNLDNAVYLLDPDATSPMQELFVAESPEMAIGQKGNTGILIEFDASKINAKPNMKKPGTAVAIQTGSPKEMVATGMDNRDFQQAVTSFSYDPKSIPKNRLQRLSVLEQKLKSVGWSKTELADGKIKVSRQPAPAVSETITPAAEPAGISVGNRIKLGKSPQTYIVEEVVPQSEAEKANNEQFYSVKNERTGEVQVVEKADMKQVGGKRVRKLFAGEKADMPQFMRDSLDAAKAMAAAGKTSEEIRAVTGWFSGKYDGKMRWEIPDRNAKITTETFLRNIGETSFEAFIDKYYNIMWIASLISIIILYFVYAYLKNLNTCDCVNNTYSARLQNLESSIKREISSCIYSRKTKNRNKFW